MKSKRQNRRTTTAWIVASAMVLLAAGCAKPTETRWQGYLEGEYVHVAAPTGGELEELLVHRGDTVEQGAPLFVLNRTLQASAWYVAGQQFEQAKAQLADLSKGVRPSELAALEAQLDQARAAAELSALEEKRVARLFADHVVSVEDNDRARLTHAGNDALVRQLEAQLATARLGGRSDRLAAAEAAKEAAESQLRAAEWSLGQRAPDAPVGGLVYDTLFEVGEQVPAGQPVVVLLPPGKVKVRFFVPEEVRSTLQAGQMVEVNLSGQDAPVPAKITYLSPQPEYTPPVLYNRENRAKLVFMVEGTFADDAGVTLLPGQPVDVAPQGS